MKAAHLFLDFYERFAEAQLPLGLSELARKLEMPASSCHNLIKAFEDRGFLYAVGQRRAYYPTKRMFNLTRAIGQHDPIGTRVSDCLVELRDATQETVILANRTFDRVIYLEVVESTHRIRYSADTGETRPVQQNSMGKALLSLLPFEERQALAAKLPYVPATGRTIGSAAAYLADIEASYARGWFLNDGESVPDVIALARPLLIHNSAFAVALAGPRHRMQGQILAHAECLKAACAAISALEPPLAINRLRFTTE